MAKHPLPDPELLRQLLRYDRKTGKLYRRDTGEETFTCIGTHGYFCGSVAGYNALLLHRVAVAIVTGEWVESVDHDNRIRLDNRWRNLIPGTHEDNHRNYSRRKDNKSGVTGVYFCASTGKWRAMIYARGGKPIRLGDFKEKDAAVAARRAAEAEHGYHPRHGINA